MKKEYTLTELLSLRSKYKDQLKGRYETFKGTPSSSIYTSSRPSRQELIFSAIRKGNVPEEEKGELCENIKARYNSLQSTIRNYQKVSSIIYKLNNQTMYNDKITLAEAVALNTDEVKDEKTRLINMLKIDLALAKEEYEKRMAIVNNDASINSYLDTVLGVDRTNVSDEDIERYVNMYHKMNDVTIIDPLGLEKLIEKLQQDYDDLYTDIDVRMSIINATTKVEVDLDSDLM